MRSGSLHFRLVAAGTVAILIALAIAGIGLTVLFERHVTRTIAEDLDVYARQLLAGIDVDSEAQLVITRPPADPRFAEPLSGLYWQVATGDGKFLRSRSLWDTTLPLPADELPPGSIHRHEVSGPAGSRLLALERRISLSIGDRRVPVDVVVAVDLARVSSAVAAFARELAVALAILGLVLAAATSIQVSLGLRPLIALRRGIADIRSGRRRRLAPAAPTEVRPLVEEVNALLDAQEGEMERSRSRAADLAHGLKTPLSALSSDAGRLRERGEHAIARDIETLGETMSRIVDREMARARTRSGFRGIPGAPVELAPLVNSLLATIARTPAGAAIAVEADVPAGLAVPVDRTDLAEVLGNLLDNAVRHAASRARIDARRDPSGVTIDIEDDGHGIAPEARASVVKRGVRMDERGGGAGLGLAIVIDVLDAYGCRLDLGASELGGLKARVRLPAGAVPARRD